MAKSMRDEEWRAFASHGTRTGKLSTVNADGSPHVAPVWFVLDGDNLFFTTGKTSVKGRNLTRDARAVLCVDDEQPPFAYAILQGRVQLSEDPAELLEWATRIGGRYMGEERAEEFGRRNGVAGEFLVRLQIEKVIAHKELAD
ncbi:PPOX class F420-dependent enzyme [Rhodococcus sp. WMMA185]|uniref:PPOX class F420-dependent oxidoreductase n=1 Tax=Rhodococcus sp. WMMA185 TaxID=679318 RepID=UPI0008784AA2|nr:PPOX class F420-dependent oxidoreductase [Rhodococcus sp. WMMA185]AOW93848.1 PPOX class F420-dependent enzyme [Rhodococcus sp. WMMA185]